MDTLLDAFEDYVHKEKGRSYRIAVNCREVAREFIEYLKLEASPRDQKSLLLLGDEKLSLEFFDARYGRLEPSAYKRGKEEGLRLFQEFLNSRGRLDLMAYWIRRQKKKAPIFLVTLAFALILSAVQILDVTGLSLVEVSIFIFPQNSNVPQPITPRDGDVVDNGCSDHSDTKTWVFSWSEVPGATKYHLHVQKEWAPIAVINETNLISTTFTLSDDGFVTPENEFYWRWDVRAFVDDNWGSWSKAMVFDVERMDTDC